VNLFVVSTWHVQFLEISTYLGDPVIKEYLKYGVVCPSLVEKGDFTTSAIVNIYHNASSTTARISF
jgi:hypothetical protein